MVLKLCYNSSEFGSHLALIHEYIFRAVFFGVRIYRFLLEFIMAVIHVRCDKGNLSELLA